MIKSKELKTSRSVLILILRFSLALSLPFSILSTSLALSLPLPLPLWLLYISSLSQGTRLIFPLCEGTANDKCCACGGGNRGPTASPTLDYSPSLPPTESPTHDASIPTKRPTPTVRVSIYQLLACLTGFVKLCPSGISSLLLALCLPLTLALSLLLAGIQNLKKYISSAVAAFCLLPACLLLLLLLLGF